MHDSRATIVLPAEYVVITYGQTEASPGITMSSTDDPLDCRVSTVGKPMPHTEMKIVDPKTGKIVSRGETGEICAHGYMIMRCYYSNPVATDQVVDKEGLLHTSDLGTLDKADYCKITGRLKEIFRNRRVQYLIAHSSNIDVVQPSLCWQIP